MSREPKGKYTELSESPVEEEGARDYEAYMAQSNRNTRENIPLQDHRHFSVSTVDTGADIMTSFQDLYGKGASKVSLGSEARGVRSLACLQERAFQGHVPPDDRRVQGLTSSLFQGGMRRRSPTSLASTTRTSSFTA